MRRILTMTALTAPLLTGAVFHADFQWRGNPSRRWRSPTQDAAELAIQESQLHHRAPPRLIRDAQAQWDRRPRSNRPAQVLFSHDHQSLNAPVVGYCEGRRLGAIPENEAIAPAIGMRTEDGIALIWPEYMPEDFTGPFLRFQRMGMNLDMLGADSTLGQLFAPISISAAGASGLIGVGAISLDSPDERQWKARLLWLDSTGNPIGKPVSLPSGFDADAIDAVTIQDRLLLTWSMLPELPGEEEEPQYRVYTAAFELGAQMPVAVHQVTRGGGSQRNPDLASWGDLHGLVYREALDDPGLYFVRLNSLGARISNPVRVSVPRGMRYGLPSIAAGSAQFVVSSAVRSSDGRESAVYAVLLSANGNSQQCVRLRHQQASQHGESLGYAQVVTEHGGESYLIAYADMIRERGSHPMARMNASGAVTALSKYACYRNEGPRYALSKHLISFTDARDGDVNSRPYVQRLCKHHQEDPPLPPPAPCASLGTVRLTQGWSETLWPRAVVTDEGVVVAYYESADHSLSSVLLDHGMTEVVGRHRVSSLVDMPLTISLARSDSGSVALVYSDQRGPGGGWRTLFQALDQRGAPVGEEKVIWNAASFYGYALGAPFGHLVAVASQDDGPQKDGVKLIGVSAGGEVLFTRLAPVSSRANQMFGLALARSPDGYGLVWVERNPDYHRLIVYAHLDRDGKPDGDTVAVITTGLVDVFLPPALASTSYGFAAAYADFSGFRGAIKLVELDPRGRVLAHRTVVEDAVFNYQGPRMLVREDGVPIVSWQGCTAYGQFSRFGIAIVYPTEVETIVLDDAGIEQSMLCGTPDHALVKAGSRIGVVFYDMRDEWASGGASSEIYLASADCGASSAW